MDTENLQDNYNKLSSPLVRGNEALCTGDFAQAITHYSEFITQQPELAKSISANLTIARKKYRTGRQAIENPSVAVCSWGLASNAAGRAYTLATIYETFAHVEIIGSLFPKFGREIWEPVRDTTIAKYFFVVEDESKFIEQAIRLVAAHPYDIVHLSKPRAPNIFFGILYKLLWDAKVLMDIDDEELAFVGEQTPISIDEYLKQYGKLPELKDLIGKDWTRLAVGLAKEFDGLTVCNAALQERYGGEIIRHARDEKLFNPSPELKRKSRAKYEILQDEKVVLFFGTPRKHKGLIETARAIAGLKRNDVIFCIVGTFPDNAFKQQLIEVKGCNFVFLPNQPVSAAQEILALADCVVLLQDADSTVAQYQTPAKLSDALALGLPVLGVTTTAMADVATEGAMLSVSPDTLAQQLGEILDEPIITNRLIDAGFTYFQRKLTLNVNRNRLLYTVQKYTSNQLDQDFKLDELYKLSMMSTLIASLFSNFPHLSRNNSKQKLKWDKHFCNKDIALIKESGLFDENWYLRSYPRVCRFQGDPITHYLLIGSRLHHNPSPHFSTKAYLAANPDVDKAGVNPLLHYVRSGRRENRRTSLRCRAIDPTAWCQGEIPTIDSVPSVLLCAHEVNEQIFGGELSFIDMLEALGQMKLNVFITVPKEGNLEYIELLRKKSCGLYLFPYGLWSKNRKSDEASIEDFIHIIKQRNIALVYCNTIVLVDPLIAARRTGRLTTVHARELIENDEHLCNRIGLDAQAIIKRVLLQTDYIIANSMATQKLFLHSRRSFLAPNVAKVKFLDMPNLVGETVIFGIVSSNLPKKGIADFVEVARRAKRLVPNARFRVIGPENDYVAELKAAGLPDNLEFSGYANSPVEAMAQANVILSLSHFTESFGRTVAEAQAARRPVIAYRWGAVPELVDDDKTGFLVNYKDIDAVVARVDKLCKEPALIETMGKEGREKILRQFSPVVLRNNLHHALSAILGESVVLRADDTRHLTIVIPVYNAFDAVERCLQSVLIHTDLSRHRVLMINDGSSDERIKPLLERFARNPGFCLLENLKNMGYTRTINRGITWAGDNDILLLNSDTIVHDGWIEGMRKIAFSTPKAGTVTAMSNNSGAFSFPKPNIANSKPENVSHDAWAKWIIGFTRLSAPIEVPTGNGFCMYICRSLLDHIGLFDEQAFPRGYGEENDFSMRAVKAGWKNFITPHTYIFHQRTASFGNEKEGLTKSAMEIINQRYPDYGRKVKAAFGSSQMKALRSLVDKAYKDVPILPTEGNVVVNKSCTVGANDNKYHVGPQKRFLSLNQTMINWHELRSRAPQRDPNLTSIIVCVFNQPSLTNKCLDALIRHSGDAKIEIIMVDNASNKETSNLLNSWAERDERITVIHNFDNLNFSLGNNIGFASSHGARVVFLNNDTEVQAGWLKPLLASLSDPEVMGVQPKLLYPDGRIQCAGVVFSGKTPLGYPIYIDVAADSPQVTYNRRFRAITGACFALRATDFAAIDGFDPIFINGQEDIDLCYRLGHGRNVFEYVAASTVTHHEGRTKGRGRFINHNRHIFVARWRDAFPGDDTDFYTQDGFVVSEYLSDRHESQEMDIACWRARITTSIERKKE